MPRSLIVECRVCGAEFETEIYQKQRCQDCERDRTVRPARGRSKLSESERRRARLRMITSEENMNEIAHAFGLSLDGLIHEFGSEWSEIREARKKGSWAGLSSGVAGIAANYDGAARYGQARRRRQAPRARRDAAADGSDDDRKPDG